MRSLLSIFCIFLSASSTTADGGTLRLSRRVGGLRVSVFTAPTPPRAGPVDVSVLVQDADTGRVQLGVPVWVRATLLEEPAHEVGGAATAAHATNKLLRGVVLDLDRPGRWRLAVEVGSPPAEVECDVAVAAPAPPWRALAPWVGWPALVVALFLLRRWGRRPSGKKIAASEPPGGPRV